MEIDTLEELSTVAVEAAETGADVIRSAGGATGTETKGTGDYVSDVDRRSEEAIATLLAPARPHTGLQRVLPPVSARPPRPPLPPGRPLLHTGQQRGPPRALLV